MPIKIFFCYAREDAHHLKKLKQNFQQLQRQGLVELWYDRDISAGSEWKHDIEQHLNSAQIILLLISQDFIASEYCYSVEMRRALERHEQGEARVIPIYLRPIYWEDVPFGRLEVLPSKEKPITKWTNRDDAFVKVVAGIDRIVKELIKTSSETLEMSADLKSTPFSTSLNISPSMPKKTREQWIKAAIAYTKERKWLKALAAYDQVTQIDPHNPINFYKKGGVLEELKRYEEALAAYQQVMQLDPLNAGVYKKVGDVLRNLKRPEEALVAYEQFIQRIHSDRDDSFDVKEAEAWMGKAAALFDLKRYKEAIASCDEATALDHVCSGLYEYEKAGMLAEFEFYEEALVAYEEAIRCGFPYASLDKADMLYKIKRYEEALVAYDDIIRYEDNYFDPVKIYINMGTILFNLNRYEEALVAYDNALTNYRLEREYAYEQDSSYASNSISSSRTDDLVNLYTGRGNVLQSLGKVEEAQQSYAQANYFTSNIS